MSEELKRNIPLFNIGEEAELENKLLFHLDEFTNEIMKTMTRDKEIIILKKVIERQHEEIEEKTTIIMAGAEKVKELEKGNRSLMESRIKWKNRYYKEKEKNVQLTNYLNDSYYVSADKIKEKIDELKKQDELSELSHNYLIIKVLQELLDENIKEENS